MDVRSIVVLGSPFDTKVKTSLDSKTRTIGGLGLQVSSLPLWNIISVSLTANIEAEMCDLISQGLSIATLLGNLCSTHLCLDNQWNRIFSKNRGCAQFCISTQGAKIERFHEALLLFNPKKRQGSIPSTSYTWSHTCWCSISVRSSISSKSLLGRCRVSRNRAGLSVNTWLRAEEGVSSRVSEW